jgi:hypothetical protein
MTPPHNTLKETSKNPHKTLKNRKNPQKTAQHNENILKKIRQSLPQTLKKTIAK